MLKHYFAEARKPERVVVLGKSGFVAAIAIKCLVDQGVEVLALGTSDLDLTNLDSAAKLVNCLRPNDVLVFVSAKVPCRNVETLMLNLRMAETVYCALLKTSISHLVYVSSDAVYPSRSNPLNEFTPLSADSMHGMMHATREMIVKSSTDSPVCVLRPSLLYGATDPHNGYGPNRFFRLAIRGEVIQLFGEGEELRDHVFVGDVATLIMLCVLHRSEGVLNIATGKSVSFRELAERVAVLAQTPSGIQFLPRKSPVTHVHFDNVAVMKTFPSFQFTELAEGLHHTYMAMRDGCPDGHR